MLSPFLFAPLVSNTVRLNVLNFVEYHCGLQTRTFPKSLILHSSSQDHSLTPPISQVLITLQLLAVGVA